MIEFYPFAKRELHALCLKKDSPTWWRHLLTLGLCLVMMLPFLVVQAHTARYQEVKYVSLKTERATLKEVFMEIRKQTGYDFVYNNEVLERAKLVSIDVQDEVLEKTLENIFRNQPLAYFMHDHTIVVKVKKEPRARALPNRIIKGTVTSAEDEGPLEGVFIVVKNTQIGAVSDADGKYSISVPDSATTLLFTHLGHTPQEVAIGELNVIDVQMVPTQEVLNEVVVQAYGTIKRSSLSNSVSTVHAKDFEQRPITSLTSALAGAAPGVQTQTESGQPGSGVSVSVRGFGSINAGTDVLYVVDGAPYGGAINNISPNDIESISVLKDASATALYGSRAANGVVIITTKKGSKDHQTIDVSGSVGVVSRGVPNYDKLNAYQYYPMMWESLRNTYEDNGYSTEEANTLASANIKTQLVYNPFNVADDEIVGTDGKINPDAKLLYPEDLSVRDAMEQSSLRQDYSMGLGGGSKTSSYYASINYLDFKGYSLKSDFNRVTGRAKLDFAPKKWFKAGVNISGNKSNSNQANEDAGTNENPFYIDLIMGPIYPIHKHDEDGNYVYDAEGNKEFDDGEERPIFASRNIVYETKNNDLFVRRNSVSGRAYATISFLKNFKFTGNAALDNNNYEYKFYRNPNIGDGVSVNGRTYRSISKTETNTFNQLLNYNKQLDDHSIDVLLGHEYYYLKYTYMNAYRADQVVDGPTEFDNFSGTATVDSYVSEDKLESYFSRAQYGYKDRYFLTGSFRGDRSSRFSSKSRWGNFWSLGGAWELGREAFLADYLWIDYLKLRSSYGEVGSNQIGYYPYQAYYELGYNNNTEPGMVLSRDVGGGDDLQWEVNQTFDVALEFNLFNDRVGGTLEYFKRGSKQLLFDVPLPSSSGRTTQAQNIGSLYNSGVEIQLHGYVVRTQDFSWNMIINGTTLKNEITKMPKGEETIVTGTKKYEVGHSIYDFWMRAWYGVDPETGSELFYADPTVDDDEAFVSESGDSLTTDGASAKYRYAGSAIPDFYGSIGNTFTYKNFSLNVMLMYQIGGTVYNQDYRSLMYPGTYGRALHKDALKRWQNPGDKTNVPRRVVSGDNYSSERYLIDGSQLSIRNVTLTYNVPADILSKVGITRARCYLNGENLYIFSKRKGLDASQSFNGITAYTYAPNRIISLGVNVSL